MTSRRLQSASDWTLISSKSNTGSVRESFIYFSKLQNIDSGEMLDDRHFPIFLGIRRGVIELIKIAKREVARP
jgi:hypothetical protein